jgi:hypothetical protein
MAYIDAQGRMMPDHSDALRVFHYLRAKDYGKYDLTPDAPSIGIHHATDSALAFGADDADMAAIGKRVVANRPWVAQFYAGRDANAAQLIRATRAAIATEGSCIYQGKKRQNNNLGLQIEWHSLAYVDLKGQKYGVDEKTKKTYVRYRTDPKRPDLRRVGDLLWQTPSKLQIQGVGEILLAAHRRWPRVNPVDWLHGHYELARGGHTDPGLPIIEALHDIGVKYLGLTPGFVVPASLTPKLPVIISTTPGV